MKRLISIFLVAIYPFTEPARDASNEMQFGSVWGIKIAILNKENEKQELQNHPLQEVKNVKDLCNHSIKVCVENNIIPQESKFLDSYIEAYYFSFYLKKGDKEPDTKIGLFCYNNPMIVYVWDEDKVYTGKNLLIR